MALITSIMVARMKPLQIEGARALAEAGAINHVRIVASAKGLFVEINQSFVVANRIKQTRYFTKADTCFTWLREMGLAKIDEVDLKDWGMVAKPPIPGLSMALACWEFSVSALIGDEWMRLANQAESLSEKGQHAEALLIAQRALQLAEDSLEPDHPDRAIMLNCLGVEHYALGQFDQAEPLYKRALEIAESKMEEDDSFISTCINNLAETYDAQGKPENTEGMYLRALNISEKANSQDPAFHTNQATIMTNLASVYNRQGAHEQAEALYRKALSIWEETTGILMKKHPNTVATLEGLADLYRKTGRESEAARLDTQAAAIKRRKR